MVVVSRDTNARRCLCEHLLAALQIPLDQALVDRVVINLGQRRVSIDDLPQQDQELHEVRVRLLPEGLFATAVQVVEERRDRVRQGVRFEIVVQRVVAVR